MEDILKQFLALLMAHPTEGVVLFFILTVILPILVIQLIRMIILQFFRQNKLLLEQQEKMLKQYTDLLTELHTMNDHTAKQLAQNQMMLDQEKARIALRDQEATRAHNEMVALIASQRRVAENSNANTSKIIGATGDAVWTHSYGQEVRRNIASLVGRSGL